jgi:multiple sugar transport system substrate-binding protein
MKRHARFLAFALAILLLSSCGKNDGVVEVQFWNFGGTPHYMEWVRARIDTFNARHSGIRIVKSDKSWNMIREILYANFSAGKGPDIMTLHANYAAEFGGAGLFYPVNTFPDWPEVKSWYLPHVLEATRFRENYYGLPGSAIAFVLMCNKELFDRAGVKPPRTWKEFREAARKLTKDLDGDGIPDQHGLVLMGGDKGGFAYRLIPFFLKAGVDVMSPDTTRVLFNDPRGVAALRLFADMYQVDHSITPGFLAYTITEVNDLFSGNKAAMSIEGPWWRVMVQEKSPGKEFYVVPVPVPDDLAGDPATAPTLQDMVMYAMNGHSAHPKEAWEALKFLRSPEADMAYITNDMGGIATTFKATQSPEAKLVPDLQLYLHELEYARAWPAHAKIIPIALNIFAPHCQKAIVGELTPEEALNEAAAEAQQMLQGRQ